MNNFLNQLQALITTLQANVYPALIMVGSLWAIQFLNWLSGYRLILLGIRPRRVTGLIGIIFAPLLHGDNNHLFANSIPLFVLLTFMLLPGIPAFILLTAFIWAGSGLLIWLLGRNAIHVGSSSVIMGYWGYLLVTAIRQPSITTVVIGLITIYYFGYFLISLLPSKPSVSWEGHLLGCVTGVSANFIFM